MTEPAILRRRGRRSLALAVAIGAAWLTIHVGGIFFWEWTAAGVALGFGLVLVQAWLSTGLFIVAHDCMHGAFAPGYPRLNTVVGSLCLAAYAGLSYAALLPKHHAHHAAPGTSADPDFHVTAPRRALPWFVGFFRSYYTHGQIVRITLAATLYVILGASLLNIVIFWAIPALIALAQLFFFGTFLPHRHGDEPFTDAHNARSSRLHPSLSLLTCYHFGAYHHEHHLHPGTPWWRLPALRREMSAPRR